MLDADTLLGRSRRVAPAVVDWAVRHTLFRHFCGGECVNSIQPTLQVRPLFMAFALISLRGSSATLFGGRSANSTQSGL